MAKITTLEQPFSIQSESDMYLAFLDGKHCQTIEEFHIQLAKALKFPDYYGRNLDALDEMLNDLDWIHEQKILLIIFRNHLWLSNDDEIKTRVLEILNEMDSKLVEIILK